MMAARSVKNRMRRWSIRLALVSVVLLIGYLFRYDVAEVVRDWLGIDLPVNPRPAGVSDLEWCERNYQDEIAALSKTYQVSYPYLMALIVLECKGNRPAGHRYERHVYERLRQLREGKLERYEALRQHHLSGLDDHALKAMASSWGPFQIMGYKAVALEVPVATLRNESTAAEIGVRWIHAEYGHFLAKKKFRDAFHYHNTGKRFPLSGLSQTHNPYYVSDGIRYMEYYSRRDPTTRQTIEPG